MDQNDNETSSLLGNKGGEKTTSHQLTCLMAAFLLINTTIGAGLLNFPTAFYQAGGVVNTIVIQIVLLFFILLSMHFLVILSYPQKRSNGLLIHFESYEEVMEYYCGPLFKSLVSWVIILYSFGTCITYLIIIGDQEEKIILFLAGGDHKPWYLRRNFDLFLISCLTILPFSYSKNIDFLKYPSAAGVLSMIYIPFIIMLKYYASVPSVNNAIMLTGNKPSSHFPYYYVPPLHDFNKNGSYDILRVIPTVCFLYNCQLSVVPIYHCMKTRSILYFSKSIFINIIICGALYNVTGIYGFLSFGEKVMINTDILTAYDPNDYKVFIAMILLVGKIVTTYPIVLFCARLALDGMWIKVRSLTEDAARASDKLRRTILATAWFALTLAITILVPDIGKVIPFLGSLSLLLIFVFPAYGVFRKIGDIGDGSALPSDVDEGLFYGPAPVYAGPSTSSVTSSSPSAYGGPGTPDVSRSPALAYLLPRGGPKLRNVLYGLAIVHIVMGTFLFGSVVTQSVMDLLVHVRHHPSLN